MSSSTLRRIVGIALAVASTQAGLATAANDPGPLPGGRFQLFTSADRTVPGLVGSYVDSTLGWYSLQDDWRVTQVVAGSRIDGRIDFSGDNWGSRSTVGLTHGSDLDWDLFSVQWDGYLEILDSDTRLATISDDSSRMWIDIDGDGEFGSTAPELVDNNWGTPQPPTHGPASVPLPIGTYRIRIQYEEQYWGNIVRLRSVPEATVRVAYLLPSDRNPQPDAVANLTELLVAARGWICEQMDRNGLGLRAPRFETGADRVTPVVHVVPLVATADELVGDHSDPDWGGEFYGRVATAAVAAGAAIGWSHEVWLIVPETHQQLPDGRVVGVVALGDGAGSGDGSGLAIVGSAVLSLANLQGLRNDTPYAGLSIPGIGPYPLVQDVSFPWFEGATIGSVVSSFFGAALHELFHGFGMPHEMRDEVGASGSLMSNGLRGIRGSIYPTLYPTQHTRISHSSARALRLNRYFAPCSELPGAPAVAPLPPGPDDTPSLAITTAGSVGLSAEGHLVVDFSASDADGLAYARLLWNGGAVAEQPLIGKFVSSSIGTPHFEPNQTWPYQLEVYDVRGNRAGASTQITVSAPANVAPLPRFDMRPAQAAPGESISFDGSASVVFAEDPDATEFTWDLGAGSLPPSSSRVREDSFPTPGSRLVTLRASSGPSAAGTSEPIAIRIFSPIDSDQDGISDDGNGTGFAGDLFCSGSAFQCDDNCRYRPNAAQHDSGGPGMPSTPDRIGDVCQCGDHSGDGRIDVLDVAILTRHLSWLLPAASADRCDIDGDSVCGPYDLAELRSSLAATAPGIRNTCAAFVGL